jgi:putative methionine-R-sulfoxide reductase with GAF domain
MEKTSQSCPGKDTGQERNNAGILLDNSQLERRSWRNWILLSAVTILTTLGLITAIQSLLSERISEIWPWAKTDLVLLVGLSLIVLVFVIYLTQHQRHILKIRENLEKLRQEREIYINRQNVRLSAMCKVSGIMGKETNLEKVFDGITSICFDTFLCYRASLMLVDHETDELVVRSIKGYADKDIFDVRQKIGEGIAGWCAKHQEPLLLGAEPLEDDKYGFELNNKKITSAMIVPICVRDELVGILNVSARDKDVIYTEEDLKVLTVFAENAGACIRHTEHAVWMRNLVSKISYKSVHKVVDTETRQEVEPIRE